MVTGSNVKERVRQLVRLRSRGRCEDEVAIALVLVFLVMWQSMAAALSTEFGRMLTMLAAAR
jgi:hypothetical protein